MIPNINLWQKKIRAKVIKEHLQHLGTKKCVCFSCGNAVTALIQAGVDVVFVGKNAKLSPEVWFTYSEIAYTFNGMFDATSGHLAMPLINNIVAEMRKEMPTYKGPVEIPTGSGETILCLRLAYPYIKFLPVRNLGEPTEYHEDAPLNPIVKLICGGL